MNKKLCLEAINYLFDEQWDEAHHIVQNLNDSYAQWIHAVVHKIEGDISNSNYWYNRSGLEDIGTFSDPYEELKVIKEKLLG